MKRIYKYTLPIVDTAIVSMPAGPHILSAGSQHEDLVLWALIDDDHEPRDQIFRIRGTGHPCDTVSYKEFIDTVPMPNGLVWHVFYIGEDQ